MAGNLLSIQILGTSFSLKSEENLDYLKEVVAYYEKKVEETGINVSVKDPLKTAILTGIIITDELLKARAKSGVGLTPPESDEAEQITRSLIDKIDSILQ